MWAVFVCWSLLDVWGCVHCQLKKVTFTWPAGSENIHIWICGSSSCRALSSVFVVIKDKISSQVVILCIRLWKVRCLWQRYSTLQKSADDWTEHFESQSALHLMRLAMALTLSQMPSHCQKQFRVHLHKSFHEVSVNLLLYFSWFMLPTLNDYMLFFYILLLFFKLLFTFLVLSIHFQVIEILIKYFLINVWICS